MIIFTAARHVGYTWRTTSMLWPSVAVFIHNGELAETTVSCLDHRTMLLIMESSNQYECRFSATLKPFNQFHVDFCA